MVTGAWRGHCHPNGRGRNKPDVTIIFFNGCNVGTLSRQIGSSIVFYVSS